MKKIIALLLAMIMVLALAACAAKTEPAQAETTAETTAPAETTETAAPADGFKVAISLAEYNEWNKLYEAVIKEKCDEWGWTYEIFDSKQDASTQIDQVNSIIAQGFNAMTIQAVDNAALAPVVGQAADNGIIVVDMAGSVDGKLRKNQAAPIDLQNQPRLSEKPHQAADRRHPAGRLDLSGLAEVLQAPAGRWPGRPH